MYIGETCRSLSQRFGEHLRSVEQENPYLPVPIHFNGTRHHSVHDMVVGVLYQASSALDRKSKEMEFIYKFKTLQPLGINADFRFI